MNAYRNPRHPARLRSPPWRSVWTATSTVRAIKPGTPAYGISYHSQRSMLEGGVAPAMRPCPRSHSISP